MAVGYGDTIGVGMLNSTLGQCAVSVRDTSFNAQKLWGIVTSLGANQQEQIAALAALPGWDDPAKDPQAFWIQANECFALAQFYYGELQNPPQFDYDDSLKGARGGQ